MPNDPRHVALVAESLRELERDLEPDGPPAGPTVQDVRQAMSDGDRIQETDGGAGTPVIGEAYSPILGLRSPGPILGPQWCRQSHPWTAVAPRNHPNPACRPARRHIPSLTACSPAGDTDATGRGAPAAAEPRLQQLSQG